MSTFISKSMIGKKRKLSKQEQKKADTDYYVAFIVTIVTLGLVAIGYVFANYVILHK